MKQEQSGEFKASLGANKLTADQLRIRELVFDLLLRLVFQNYWS